MSIWVLGIVIYVRNIYVSKVRCGFIQMVTLFTVQDMRSIGRRAVSQKLISKGFKSIFFLTFPPTFIFQHMQRVFFCHQSNQINDQFPRVCGNVYEIFWIFLNFLQMYQINYDWQINYSWKLRAMQSRIFRTVISPPGWNNLYGRY